jgi:putative membrane fusion protein
MKKKIFKILFIIAVILYIGKVSFNAITGKDKTALVNYGNLTEAISADAYIIRNETIIDSPITGEIKKMVSSGERVPKGTKIAEVISSNLDKNKLKELDDINKKIQEIKNNPSNNPYEADIENLENLIKKEEEKYQDAVKNNSNSVDELKKQIEDLKNKKEQIINKGPSSLKDLEDLKNQKALLEQVINPNLALINAPEAGMVSFYFDKYENQLDTKKMYNLTSEMLSKISKESIEKNGNIKQNDMLVKIIDNSKWYLAIPINNDDYKLIKEGEKIKVNINGYDNQLRGDVLKVYKTDGKAYIAIINMIDMYKDLYKVRKVKVNLILNDYTGYEVPKSSVINNKGKTGVFILNNIKYPVFKEVIVKAENDKITIIENKDMVSGIKMYDKVAVNGKAYVSK